MRAVPIPPFRTPLLGAGGEMHSEWRRFYLDAHVAIRELQAFTLRIGSSAGLMDLEDRGAEDVAMIVPGPKGDPGPTGTQGVPGALFMDGDSSGDDVGLLGVPIGPTLGYDRAIGRMKITGSGTAHTAEINEPGVAATTLGFSDVLILRTANFNNWGLGILNTSYSTVDDNAIQMTQTNAGFWVVWINNFQRFAVSPTGVTSIYGKFDLYNNILTAPAGWGIPAIYGSGRATAQTAAVASVATYTVGAADGSFRVSANVLVTASTTHSFTVECAYTDEGNTARVLTLAFSLLAGTWTTDINNANGAVPYQGATLHIRAKAATAITIRTQAAGTYTTVTYNVEGSIVQIA